MEESHGCGCLALIIIIIVITAFIFNFFNPDTNNERYDDYDDPHTISVEEERHCRELGGTEAMCAE